MLVDDPGQPESEICYEPRRPPSPQEFTESVWAEVDRLRQELLPQPYDLPLRRSHARSSPQQPCSVSRAIMAKVTVESEEDG